MPQDGQPLPSLVPYMLLSASLSIGYGSVFTLLAEFRERFGFDETQLGLIAASGFFAGFVAQVGLARFADRGHARILIWFGMASVVASMVGMSVATEYWQFLVARLLFGLGSGSIVPAIRRIIITRDPDALGENLGTLTAYEIGGFVLGPAIAAVLAEVAGIRVPFIALAVLYSALLVVIGRLDLDTEAAERSSAPIRQLLALPQIVAGLLVAVAIYTTIGIFEAVWALLLDDLGASTPLIGISLSLFTIPMILFARRGGRTAQEIGPMRLIRLTVPAAMVCMLIYGWTENLWVVLAVSLIHAIADAFSFPGAQVQVAHNSPAELVATAQGLFSSSGTLTSGIVAGLSGWAYDEFGPGPLFTAGVVVMAAALGGAMLLSGTTPSAQAETATQPAAS